MCTNKHPQWVNRGSLQSVWWEVVLGVFCFCLSQRTDQSERQGGYSYAFTLYFLKWDQKANFCCRECTGCHVSEKYCCLSVCVCVCVCACTFSCGGGRCVSCNCVFAYKQSHSSWVSRFFWSESISPVKKFSVNCDCWVWWFSHSFY